MNSEMAYCEPIASHAGHASQQGRYMYASEHVSQHANHASQHASHTIIES